MRTLEEIFEEFMKGDFGDDVPECCKSCDVFQYGMSASYCDNCNGPVCFYFDDDDEIDWDEDE